MLDGDVNGLGGHVETALEHDPVFGLREFGEEDLAENGFDAFRRNTGSDEFEEVEGVPSGVVDEVLY